jgi:gamma-glutamylputrescine oxidase
VNDNSYWLEEEWSLPARPTTAAPPDVVVIGGGVTGCACALRLAQAGVRVRLHDARSIAGGASGRNGGFALRGASRPYDETHRALGAEVARTLMTSTEEGLRRLASLAGDAFRPVGSLRLAASEGEIESLRAEHDLLAADGFAVEWVDGLDAPLDALYLGAILHPTDGAIQPARWVRRLATHAVEAGAELREHAPITPERAAREADVVVVATDGFTAATVAELARHVVPTRGQVLLTEPLPERRYARPHYARGGFDYWQQLPDGRLVLGGRRDASLATEATDVEETTEPIQARLDELAEQLVGSRVPVTHRWAGIWGTTADGLPLVGRLPGHERAWIAAGYSGHGNVLGLVCGRLVADAILGEPSPLMAVFDPSRVVDG